MKVQQLYTKCRMVLSVVAMMVMVKVMMMVSVCDIVLWWLYVRRVLLSRHEWMTSHYWMNVVTS